MKDLKFALKIFGAFLLATAFVVAVLFGCWLTGHLIVTILAPFIGGVAAVSTVIVIGVFAMIYTLVKLEVFT